MYERIAFFRQIGRAAARHRRASGGAGIAKGIAAVTSRRAKLNMARLLDHVEYPKDIRGFSIEQLDQLAAEMREEVISVVSEVGGHFASTLGAIELTLALHYAFNTPEDRIVWDTGHQCY